MRKSTRGHRNRTAVREAIAAAEAANLPATAHSIVVTSGIPASSVTQTTAKVISAKDPITSIPTGIQRSKPSLSVAPIISTPTPPVSASLNKVCTDLRNR